MKSFILKALPLALLVSSCFLASCEDEPEVGSLLYPEDPITVSPIAYLHEMAFMDNKASISINETPLGIDIPNDTISFYLKLNKPAGFEATVTLGEIPNAVQDNNDKLPVLPEGVINFINKTVKIPAGQVVSSEPAKFVINNSDALKNFDGKAITAFGIVEVSDNIVLSKEYNSVDLSITKNFTNIKPEGSLSSHTLIPTESYTISDRYDDNITVLTDNNTSTQRSIYSPLIFKLSQATEVSGISYIYGRYPNSMPKVVEVQTSQDGDEYTMQGTYTLLKEPTNFDDLGMIEFYKPVKCKYIKFTVISSFSYSRYLSEVDLYTK